MNVVVFLGPSLPLDEAAGILAADYRPPVSQGDVLDVIDERPDAIAIIDGYFELVPSVWHKEILLALEQGIAVYGAASMGALRAAELERFGMAGVGEVFRWYRSGAIVDDDEVAVAHGPAESAYRSFSVAMVDLRTACADAANAGVIAPGTHTALIDAAKAMFYPDRSVARMIEAVRPQCDGVELDAFERFARHGGPWQKERDARLLLTELAAAVASGRFDAPARPARVERTVFIEMLANDVSQRSVLARHNGEEIEPTDSGDLMPVESLEVARKKVLLRLLIRREAERRGLSVTEEEMQASADDFRREKGLLTVEQAHQWFETNGLTEAGFVQIVRDRSLSEQISGLMRQEIEREVADQVRVSREGVRTEADT